MNIGQPVWVYYLSERKQLIMVQVSSSAHVHHAMLDMGEPL